MKSSKATRKAAYIGAGVGVILFCVFGLLPSSFVGGMLGLKIAGHIFGPPVGFAIMPRIIVGLAMVLAVLVSITVFVSAGAITAWIMLNMTYALSSTRLARAYFTGHQKVKKAKGSEPGQDDSERES